MKHVVEACYRACFRSMLWRIFSKHAMKHILNAYYLNVNYVLSNRKKQILHVLCVAHVCCVYLLRMCVYVLCVYVVFIFEICYLNINYVSSNQKTKHYMIYVLCISAAYVCCVYVLCVLKIYVVLRALFTNYVICMCCEKKNLTFKINKIVNVQHDAHNIVNTSLNRSVLSQLWALLQLKFFGEWF